MFERILYIITYWLFAIMVWMAATPARADLNYNTYAISTYAPTLEFPYYDNSTGYNTDGSNTSPYGLGTTVLSSGTISAPSGYYWGSGYVLDSGRADSVAVEVTGYITWPGTTGQETTVYFGVSADDGVFMNIDGTNVITDWQQQGTTTWNATGSLTRTAGEQYEITVWMYEWGGGATLDINYSLTDYSTSTQTDMPASWFSTTASTPTSSATSTQTTLRTTTRGITSTGNQIYITQSGDNIDLDIVQYDNDQLIAGTGSTANNLTNATITGDDNTVSITQGNSAGSFSDDNVVLFDLNGTNNNVNIRQGDNVDDAGGHRMLLNVTGNYNTTGINQHNDGGVGSNGHFMDIDIAGNSNTAYMDQKSDGDKMLFLDVNGNSNTIDTLQQGTGEHFLDVTLGSNQSVDITQEGSGDHAATIDMSGYSTTLDLSQGGSTDKNYTLNTICTNSNGCGTTTVNQQ
jgi:hypothetical protein